jgi:thiamine phosphate synthase YjbQ (UPF0047 family)
MMATATLISRQRCSAHRHRAHRRRQLVLGTWQQVFHLECDVRGRQRTIVVTVVGD